jgi:outer membrane protein assembly factor BamB
LAFPEFMHGGCRTFLCTSLLLMLAIAPARGENWPAFRGPTGMGTSSERNLPTKWNIKTGENIVWKVELKPTAAKGKADLNQSSPIVWGDQVIVATVYWPEGTAQSEFPEQHVTSYRLADGSEEWDCKVPVGAWKLSDLRGGYGAATAATDGKHIYIPFGSATLACLDMQGRLVWQKPIEHHESIDVAFATSPVLYKDHVLLLSDKNNKNSTLTAYDAATGEIAWTQKRPDVAFNHTTPLLATIAGKPQLIVAASNVLQGLDPESGEVIWKCATPGDVTMPVIRDNIVYSDSGRGGPGLAVDATGKGDVAANVKWRIGNIPEGLSSPVIAGDYLLRTHNPGVLRCIRWSDGGQQYSGRLNGASMQSSPVVTADGLVYFASGGRSYVIRPGKTLDIVATSDLDDAGAASPAISHGKLIIKGTKYLYAIGNQ